MAPAAALKDAQIMETCPASVMSELNFIDRVTAVAAFRTPIQFTEWQK
jgi:hypothetical protein